MGNARFMDEIRYYITEDIREYQRGFDLCKRQSHFGPDCRLDCQAFLE